VDIEGNNAQDQLVKSNPSGDGKRELVRNFEGFRTSYLDLFTHTRETAPIKRKKRDGECRLSKGC